MGNHSVGKAFHAAFRAIDKRIDIMSREELTEFMDELGNEYNGTDAEFDDYCDLSFPLGRALVKVFNPDLPTRPNDPRSREYNEWSDIWYETVYKPFRERYEFW